MSLADDAIAFVCERPHLRDRFLLKVRSLPDTSACWEWTGCRDENGYGRFSARKRCVLAHRVAWALSNGPAPSHLCVCHRCDNPPCCNPAHMFIGTKGDNNRDMYRKGRAVDQRGVKHSQAKLTEADVLEIWAAKGTMQQSALARRFGVNQGTISHLLNGHSWRHVTGAG